MEHAVVLELLNVVKDTKALLEILDRYDYTTSLPLLVRATVGSVRASAILAIHHYEEEERKHEPRQAYQESQGETHANAEALSSNP